MSQISVWVETIHHTAFRCGGWAYVRGSAAAPEGAAGGDRHCGPERVALSGLAAALSGLPAGAAVTVRSASPLITAVPRRIAGFEADPPAENLELWAQVATALKGLSVSFVPMPAPPRTPGAFAVAWAELSRDKAKATGAFRAAIPRTNLGKAGL